MHDQIQTYWANAWPIAEALLQTKWARALGMLALVWITIWIIAVVYSGYLQNSEIGPVGIRTHIGKRLGERTIVFDRNIIPYQMDGVDAHCQFYLVYGDGQENRLHIPLGGMSDVQLHIRPTTLPQLKGATHFGFECNDERIANLPFQDVIFPPFDIGPEPPDQIGATPLTVKEYIEKHNLIEKWTEDDTAPLISIGATRLSLLSEERIDHIVSRAQRLQRARNGGFFRKWSVARHARNRANVFASFHVKLQFSNHPWFVLFRHPNRELKMTAWLTVLTSFFAIAMDMWPVRDQPQPQHSERATITAPPRSAHQ